MANYTTLQNGSRGDEVKKLQTQLNANGYNLAVDGIFGNNTLSAVKDYQQKNNLAVDGIVGKNTWGVLNKNSTTTTAPSPTTTNTTPTAPATPQNNTSYKYEEFKYTDPAENDIVKQANAMLQEQMNNKPGEFQYAWQTQLDDIYNKIMNREEFSYDLNGDALYQQYKDQYTTQGQMAMMDTMGQAAAMTGGYGNSYAQTAGQQAYQGYLQQLNDKVPELYQLALSQYNQEEESLYNKAALLGQQKEQEYGMHRDKVTDWKDMLQYYTNNYNTAYDRVAADQEFKYGMHNDKQNINYQLSRDAIEDANTAKSQASEMALSMLSLGTMPTAELLASAGISSADANAIVNKVKADEAASAASSSSSKGNVDKQGGSAESDFIRFTYSGTNEKNEKQVFYRDGKKYEFEKGVNPYTGTKNADAKNGTFSNGYQPNNIGGKKLSNSGIKDYVNGVEQTVWQTPDGTKYIWDGTKNRYLRYED